MLKAISVAVTQQNIMTIERNQYRLWHGNFVIVSIDVELSSMIALYDPQPQETQ